MFLKSAFSRMTKHKYVLPLFLGIFLSFFFFSAILLNIHAFGIQDWDQNFAWSEFSRLSIVKYHQFPLWNPYRCGGVPHFANPEMSVLSIQTIFVLLFGTVVGIKISILFHSILAFVGFYLLSRYYKVSPFGSILASAIFTFSGITGSFLFGGMISFIIFAYTPFIVIFYLKGQIEKKWLFVSAFIFSLDYYYGYHIPLPLLLFIFLYAVVQFIYYKKSVFIWNFVIFILTFIILSLPKLLLSFQLLSLYPRISLDFSGFTFPNLLYFLLSRRQNLFGDMNITGYTYGIDENSLYVGILPFLLFCFFFIKNTKQIRKHIILVILLICMTLLMLGNQIHPSLYNVLKKLPFFASFRVAQRFRFDFIIPFALFVGMGLDRLLLFPVMKKYRKFLFLGIFLFIFIDLTAFNQENFLRRTLVFKDYYNTTFSPTFVLKTTPHYNISYIPNLIPRPHQNNSTSTPSSFEFVSLRMGVGVTDCYNVFDPKISALPASSPRYRGEWYSLKNAYMVSLIQWTPQQISFSVIPQKNTSPTEDTLILNQNYFPGWYVKRGETFTPAINTNGLISTRIHGEKNIQFIYMPYWALGLNDRPIN
jgi:hypothetical protein